MNDFFVAEEYQTRLTRARAAMQQRGLDALLLTAPTNVEYFSGHRPLVGWDTLTRSSFCLVPAAGDPILIVHDVWLGGAVADSAWHDVRAFPETTRPPLATLADCFQDRQLLTARVGLELGYEQRLGLSFHDLQALQARLPQVSWLDAAPAIWDVRMIKSAAEIDKIRRACAITDAAFDMVFQSLAPGMTEAELASRLQAGIATQGAEFGFMAPCMVPAGYMTMSRVPSRHPLVPGELIFCDLGAIYHGYWSDYGRAAVIGKASDRQRRMWEDVHAVTQAGLAEVRPGHSMSAVVAACNRTAQRVGLAMNFASGRIGHGLGMQLTEPPHVAGHETELLRPGMVITLEPGIVSPQGVYIVEQDIAVTETGAEQLSTGRWEIWEV